jgi:hypothetical protein
LAALGGRLEGDGAGIDDPQIRLLRRFSGVKPVRAKQGSNLLAFVLVDLATEGLDGKSSHRKNRVANYSVRPIIQVIRRSAFGLMAGSTENRSPDRPRRRGGAATSAVKLQYLQVLLQCRFVELDRC